MGRIQRFLKEFPDPVDGLGVIRDSGKAAAVFSGCVTGFPGYFKDLGSPVDKPGKKTYAVAQFSSFGRAVPVKYIVFQMAECFSARGKKILASRFSKGFDEYCQALDQGLEPSPQKRGGLSR